MLTRTRRPCSASVIVHEQRPELPGEGGASTLSRCRGCVFRGCMLPLQVRASVSQQLRFHNTAASRRRAVVQFVPEPSTRPPAHVPMCARSAGSRWVPQSKRSLHCSARSHCGAAPRRRSMSGLQGQCFSAARGLRQGPGRPHGAPEAAGVASLMTCATRRRGQLRFHNAPHFWHPPASRA